MYGHRQHACHFQGRCRGLSCRRAWGFAESLQDPGHLGGLQPGARINSIAASQSLLHLITHRFNV